MATRTFRHACRSLLIRASSSLVVASAIANAGIVAQVTNAPVAPDTIYVGRLGTPSGISVIDLNGFGASTGNPTYDPTFQSIHEGDSNYPNNPNVKYQGSLLIPPLAPGTTTINGGSAGVFTLTKDSLLDDLLLRAPAIRTVGDMMLGQPLDRLYNNGPAPSGCMAGGGNLCLANGLMVVSVAFSGGNTLVPSFVVGMAQNTVVGGGNPISWAPHPNPPPLLDAPTCLQPLIRGQEPTSILSLMSPPSGPGLSNLLAPGDPFGVPASGISPTGLLSVEQNSFFVGPGAAQPTIAACQDYMQRQQIGHFLYVIEPARRELVVLNSNTMSVLARIALSDPTELAMSPNLDFLAVTERSLDMVSIIDIDPTSSTFHQVVHSIPVGAAPSGVAWDPGNEDILVCNEGDDTISILSTSAFQVRKVVGRGLDRPFAIAITQRQQGFGFERNLYYAYILDRSGHVSLFESGPHSINGWGYDNIVGQFEFVFHHPKALQPDPIDLRSAVWIVHEDQLDHDGHPTGLTGGAVSKLVFESGLSGMLFLDISELHSPHLRDMTFAIERSIGSDQLSGVPTDIAFDDQRNLGALQNLTSSSGSGTPAPINGKSQVRKLASGSIVNTNEPTYMFLPSRDRGVVDVIRLTTGMRVDTNAFRHDVQSIPAAGAAIVMDYFRQ